MYVEIKTERLRLRPLQISDLETTHAYASDVENTRYMIYLPNHALTETKQFLTWAEQQWAKDAPDDLEFAILLQGNHIGAISLSWDKSNNVGEFGWILHRNYWKRGYALEAALALKAYAIDTLKIRKLIAHCDSKNVNSARLMEKIGMKREDLVGTRQYPDSRGTSEEFTYCLEVTALPPRA
ncbi:MAG: GNAT family N-acetyltransferase [Clostridiales bacterium]|nr:GNAT family N-acetyltransferase [Clostridiales bacterium]